MYALKLFYILILFILFPSLLFSTTYENATNKKTDKWHVLKYFAKGKIKNIYDKKKKSRVIKFNGDSTKSVYILMPNKKVFKREKGENIFQWEMNYHEDFVIMIGMQTLKGKRYLIYTSGDKNSYLQYGLGADSISGKWKKYSRNLQEDLEYFDRYNRVINVISFVIKGSGMVDNIKMVKSKKSVIATPISTVPKVIEDKDLTIYKEPKIDISQKNSEYNKSNEPPIIHLKGKNPMILKRGERYIEPGATATNRDGSSVEVSISEDIDIFQDGEYSVIYMATNSAGNSVVDRRRVRVGNVVEERESRVVINSNSNSVEEEKAPPPLEEEEEEDVDLEQRALEILDWEKQLSLREEELEKEMSSKANINYPSRPGL